jgi:putative transcriptional regulator
MKKLIGQRVVELRTKKGWSQADLARETGKDRQAIEKLENGKVNPTLYSLVELAKALDVTLSVLVDI